MKTNLHANWAVWNEIRRILVLPFIWIQCRLMGLSWSKNWRVLGAPIIQKYKGSRIKIGDNLVMRSWVSSNPVAPYHSVFLSTRNKNAEIIIGDNFGMTGGSIVAAERIIIGNHVLIGGNCLITDTDFHPLEKEKRKELPKESITKPVIIGNDVFIGAQSIVLKGTTIGEGSIIGAGSVVSGDIPENVIAAGNPAIIIRKIGQ